MKPEGSSAFSKQPVTGPYLVTVEFIPPEHPSSLKLLVTLWQVNFKWPKTARMIFF